MGLLMLLAGFSFLCLCGAIGSLITAQRLLNRAFDMINFSVALSEKIRVIADKIGIDFDLDVLRKEGTD